MVAFLPQVSKVYSLEDIDLVPNLATRACGGTVVYPVLGLNLRVQFLGTIMSHKDKLVFLPHVSYVYRIRRYRVSSKFGHQGLSWQCSLPGWVLE